MEQCHRENKWMKKTQLKISQLSMFYYKCGTMEITKRSRGLPGVLFCFFIWNLPYLGLFWVVGKFERRLWSACFAFWLVSFCLARAQPPVFPLLLTTSILVCLTPSLSHPQVAACLYISKPLLRCFFFFGRLLFSGPFYNQSFKFHLYNRLVKFSKIKQYPFFSFLSRTIPLIDIVFFFSEGCQFCETKLQLITCILSSW